MRLFNHHFLGIFVALLVTVFVTNTVYAGSMMVSASFNTIAASAPVQSLLHPQAVLAPAGGHHCHDHAGSDQYHSHQNDSGKNHSSADILISNQSHDQSPSHGGCGHCNHCLACYSMMFYDQVNVAPVSSQPVLAIATHVLYLAPTNPQPNKPPIS
jgi:hypothetical protein